jgi:hypothetical protein
MTRPVRVEKSRARYRHPDRDEVTVNLDTIRATESGEWVQFPSGEEQHGVPPGGDRWRW